jgi:hypothetical protein
MSALLKGLITFLSRGIHFREFPALEKNAFAE